MSITEGKTLNGIKTQTTAGVPLSYPPPPMPKPEAQKPKPVYLQVRDDGKVWAVLEDGTPLAHQTDVTVSTSATRPGIEVTVTLKSAGWIPSFSRF